MTGYDVIILIAAAIILLGCSLAYGWALWSIYRRPIVEREQFKKIAASVDARIKKGARP